MLIAFCSACVVLPAAGNMEIVLPDLSQENRATLLAGDTLDGTTLNGGHITHLLPIETRAYEKAVAAEQADNSFTITTLGYVPYPEKLKSMELEERQLALFNAMRQISTQEGLTYISWRAGNKPKTLFEESRYISDPKKRNDRLEDPVATVFPLTEESYVYQKDTSFGGNTYKHTYTNNDREIFLEVKNISSMKVMGLFTAVPSEQLKMNIATYQLDDGLLIMAMATIEDKAPTISVLGYKVDLPSAFMRRITALQTWFVAQVQQI